MTLAIRLLAAIRAGASTSTEAAARTGIDRATAKVVVHDLVARGCVAWTGRYVERVPGSAGRLARVYEVVDG